MISSFTPNTNNLQRNVSGHHNYNNYFNSDNNYASSPHQLYQNNNTNFSAAQNNFNNEKIKSEIKAPRTEKRGIIDDETFKMFCQMVELKKFSGQNQLSSGRSASIGDLQQQFIGRQISGELLNFLCIKISVIIIEMSDLEVVCVTIVALIGST